MIQLSNFVLKIAHQESTKPRRPLIFVIVALVNVKHAKVLQHSVHHVNKVHCLNIFRK